MQAVRDNLEPGKYISPRQLADRWNASPDFVHEMLAKGKMRYMVLPGSNYKRILFNDVLDYEIGNTSIRSKS